MASQDNGLKVIETYQISPPLDSVPQTTQLPLTFFDIPWLLFSPSQPLFFYELSLSTNHFSTTTILLNLKHSLSLTLQHFFPLAGYLKTPPPPTKPCFSYTAGDSVTLTVAESTADFHRLSGHHHRDVQEFYHLVPGLSSSVASDPHVCPLLAVQITVFPECGICMGFTFRHVAADGRTFNNFLKSWASICNVGSDLDMLVPFCDRSVIQDPNGLGRTLLNEWWSLRSSLKVKVGMDTNGIVFEDMVRATFVVGQPDMEKLKRRIITRSEGLFGSCSLLLSPYVVTCALLWVSLVKVRGIETENEREKLHYFGFIAGGLTRLDFPVPEAYLGNCVGFGRSALTRNQLLGKDGFIFAAKAIGDTIKKLNGALLGDGERWISDWKELLGSDIHVVVTGSPKLHLYELDFGWGRPKKIEEIAIDKTRAVSLTDSRDVMGGIEVGLALPRPKMEAFGSLFSEGLNGPL